jgi:hypothetical protein
LAGKSQTAFLTAINLQRFLFAWTNEGACRRKKFQTDAEQKCNILIWLCGEDKTFHAAGISNMP